MIEFSPEFKPSVDPDEGGGPIQPNSAAKHPGEIITDWEGYARSIQTALDRVGMIGAERFTPNMLQEFGTEILRRLTPLTAECLYFDAYRCNLRETHRGLLTPTLLIAYAKYHQSYGMDLEKLQLLQRSENLGRLYQKHIDANQVLRLAGGNDEMQQNINRLTFFLFDTPELAEFAQELEHESTDENPHSIETVIIEGQAKINARIEWLEGKKKEENEEEPDPEKRWNPFILASYIRAMHRLQHRLSLGDLILEELRSAPTSPDDWFGTDEPFSE